MPVLCRDCAKLQPAGDTPWSRCPSCGSPRSIAHPELQQLNIAHLDCDAFYASVEKRDNPALKDKPVIVGGGRRGVVSAACYVARMYGVRSAMPMFQALKACPKAVVLPPDMAKYSQVGQEVRELMLGATPAVEPLSIDEAFLDLGGTERLHHGSPAETLIRLVQRIEREIGVTVSIGLSYNKFLAKIASDLDKPRGFSVIGRADARKFLAAKPVSLIWGVGKAMQAQLAQGGIYSIGQLQTIAEEELIRRFGSLGSRLYHFSRGEDDRTVEPDSEAKSISAETTFERDLGTIDELSAELWPLCERLARRLRRNGFAAKGLTLKLKTAEFRILTRSRKLPGPTGLAEIIYRTALPLLEAEADGRRYRLIGIGTTELADAEEADLPDLFAPDLQRVAGVERAMVAVREKLGTDAIHKGRGWRKDAPAPADDED
ncbi:MAG TPA: DNA polymerase IV [Dongiaceae bacterium]